MRELYNEFFYIPKHGKIREKVMLVRVAMILAIMVVCLAAMSITAYAYFSYNVTSGSNIIQAANFDAQVTINNGTSDISLTKDGKIQTANLEAGNYTIEISEGNSTADKGFCVITIGDKTYFTDQIGVDADKELEHATVKFELKLSAPTKIEVLSHWGTSKYYGYKDDGRTEIFIVSGDKVDLTTATQSSDTGTTEGTTEQTGGTTTTPSANTTAGTESTASATGSTASATDTTTSTETTPSETTGASNPTTTTEPSASSTEPTETQSAETTPAETTGTETSEPAATDPAATESTSVTETQPATENSETTGAPTTEASE